MKAALFVLVLTMPTICTAQPASNGMGYGLGMHSCGEFANLYVKDPVKVEEAFFGWAQGFISGANLASAAANKAVRTSVGTIPVQRAIIRQYCNDHPLAPYYGAVLALYQTFAPIANSN